MKREEIKEAILYLLQGTSPTGDGTGHTFLEIRQFLKLNNVKGYFEDNKEAWNRLKELLNKMEEEGLIEERHFGEVLCGRVDYSIEEQGIDLIEKRKKLEDKWKLVE